MIDRDKPATGYRHYPPQAIARIRFIKRAQHSGFSLKEISELLSLDSGHCEDIQKMAELKHKQINQQIRDLTALRSVLEQLIQGCQDDQSTEHCSLINALSNQSNTHS